MSWSPSINGLPEVGYINAAHMSIEQNISENIFIFCRTKTDTARLRFFMVSNFVPSDRTIPNTKVTEFAPKAQAIFSRNRITAKIDHAALRPPAESRGKLPR